MNHQTGECSLPDCFCHVAQRLERGRSDGKLSVSSSESAVVVAPTFTEEWDSAPRAMTNYVESNIAEYWFLRGVRAGEAGAENEELHAAQKQVEQERKIAVRFLVKRGYARCAKAEHDCDGWHDK